MAISGPWMLGELSPKLRVGVAPLPLVTASGKLASPFLGAEGVMMSAKSSRKAAGFRAMTYLTGDRAAVARAIAARQPVANHAAWRHAKIKADPVLRAFRAQLDSATVMPGTPQMRLVWSPYDMALQKVMSGRASPGQALKEAAAEVRRFLKAMKRGGQE